MRYLLLSDVHANQVALDAVLAHARPQGWDEVLFLGDAVGYYADPEAVVRTLIELEPSVAVIGNHDHLLLELRDGRPGELAEGTVVRPVLERHVEALSEESVAFLRAMERHHVSEGWEAVHGALVETWQYLAGVPQAEMNVPLMRRRLCLVGHTHVPKVIASVTGPGERRLWRTVSFPPDGGHYRLPPRASAFFNPGSVGQPRDGVPLASYGLFDVEKGLLQVVRVPFDVPEVQRRLEALAYPRVLGARLAMGR